MFTYMIFATSCLSSVCFLLFFLQSTCCLLPLSQPEPLTLSQPSHWVSPTFCAGLHELCDVFRPALSHACSHPFSLDPASSTSASLSVHVVSAVATFDWARRISNLSIALLLPPPLPDSVLLSRLSCPTSS